MITNLTSSSPHIRVSSVTHPHIGNTGQNAGDVRFNTMTQQIEAFDGYRWTVISTNANIELSHHAEETIRWAQDKMAEEVSLKKLAEENAAVKIALENVKKAQEQLKVTAHMAEETQ